MTNLHIEIIYSDHNDWAIRVQHDGKDLYADRLTMDEVLGSVASAIVTAHWNKQPTALFVKTASENEYWNRRFGRRQYLTDQRTVKQ